MQPDSAHAITASILFMWPPWGRTLAHLVSPRGYANRANDPCDVIPGGMAGPTFQSLRRGARRVREEPMSIRGVITMKHVLRHARVIVREFGLDVFVRCCLGSVRRRKTTFLECVF